MDVELIQEILQEQKLESVFLVDIQCQLYGLLIKQKTSIFLSRGKLNEKSLCIFKITRKKYYHRRTKEELKSHQDAKVIFIFKY